MFTCCERKLLVKIRENSNRNNFSVELNVTKKICQICKREIYIIGGIKIQSSNTESDLSEENLEQMDNYAKDIFNSFLYNSKCRK